MAEAQLLQASRDGDIATVKQLLADGTKQTSNEDGDTPLLLATSCYITEPRYGEVVRELIEHGADVNETNKAGDSAVHNAASLGNFETTELLIEYEANLETEGGSKLVPLGLAAMKKHHAVVTLIVNKLLETDKLTQMQFKWMFDATDANQQLTIYRALSSIVQIKGIIAKMIPLNLTGAICHGLKKFDKKGVLTHALQLLQEVVNTPEGLEAAKQNGVNAIVKETMDKYAEDAVLQHLGNQVLESLK